MLKQAAFTKPLILVIGLCLLVGAIFLYWQKKAIEVKPHRVISFNRGLARQFGIDSDGNICLVYDASNQYVVKLDGDGNIVHEYRFNLAEILPGEYLGFRSICLDSEGNIYMLNYKTKKLIKVDNQGDLVEQIIVNFEFPQYPVGDFRETQLEWIGVDETGVYLVSNKLEFGVEVPYLVSIDLATWQTNARRFQGSGPSLPDEAISSGAVYTFSTESSRGIREGKLALAGMRLYLNKYDVKTEDIQRYYMTLLHKPSTNFLTYSEYDNSVYYYDQMRAVNGQPTLIMKFCLGTSQLSGFSRLPHSDSLGYMDMLRAFGDKLYYLRNTNDKVVIYEFQL